VKFRSGTLYRDIHVRNIGCGAARSFLIKWGHAGAPRTLLGWRISLRPGQNIAVKGSRRITWSVIGSNE
jgi:hypothetical protein